MLYPPRHAASPRAEDLELGGPAPVADGGQAHLIDLHAQGDQHDPGLSREPLVDKFGANVRRRCRRKMRRSGPGTLGVQHNSEPERRTARCRSRLRPGGGIVGTPS
jgi:hypothetical protein